MRLSRSIVCAAVTAWVGSIAIPNALSSPDDRALSVSLNYGQYSLADHSPNGMVVGADYEYGLSDAVSLRASGGAGVYYADGPAYSGHLTCGITYLFDVLKYVPYANAGVGGIAVGGDAFGTNFEPLVEVGAGVDVLRRRSFSWGVLARYERFLNATSFVTVGARITWRWGYF